VRVLLISDRMLLEMRLRLMMEAELRGIDLVWRVSPSMGLAECANDEPLKLIVIDLDMQGAKRLELAKKVLDLPHGAMVVTLTSMPSDEEAARARTLGVNAYLRKDMPRDELVQVLRAMLES